MVEIQEQDADTGAGSQALGHDAWTHVAPPADVEEPGERVGQGAPLQLAVHLRVAPRRSRDETEQRAALQVLFGEGVETVAPDVEHAEALVTRDQGYGEQRLGLAQRSRDGRCGWLRVGVGAAVW